MKDKIIEVALEQFLKHGIRSMTIKKLVEPMGISTKTVYKYFASKQDLLSQCLHVLYNGYFNDFSLILSNNDSPVNLLLILFRGSLVKDFGVTHAFFHDLNYYYPELQNAAINRGGQNYRDFMIPLIERGVNEGYFNAFTKPDLALMSIITLYSSITRGEELKTHKGEPYVLFKNLVEVYIRGMCTEKGLKEIENNPYHND